MIEHLRKLKLFKNLNNDDLQFIANITKKENIKKNDIIFNENDAGQKMYIILSGRVEISKNLIGNNKKILTILEENNFFGEIAIFDNKNRSANAIAIEDTSLLTIDKEDFFGLLDNNDRIAHHCFKNIFLELCNRLREVNKSVQERILWGFSFD